MKPNQTKKKLYTVFIEREYFPEEFFSTEREAVDWVEHNGYRDDEFDILKLYSNYKPETIKKVRTLY